MKFSKSAKFSLMLFAGLILMPQQVWACACCADNGQYRISMKEIRGRKAGYALFGALLNRLHSHE